ncbi:MAG: Mrp/NBP35 family ATP-binding protein [Lentisphaeria bacterium]|nr:Mrp/NBP35 family ATP-binding protein [Lentisphaeria bacterium]
MQSERSACETCTKAGCAARPRQAGESPEQYEARMQLAERMGRIRHKVLVLSGKGGVGKSTVAANLAIFLALHGRRVGLLDVDIHGPSIPKLLGLESYRTVMGPNGMLPAEVSESLRAMSIGFLLPETDAALIWRGPMKIGVIQQFLRDTDWGPLDFLVVDCPPGTGDEPLSVAQSLGDADGAVVVTTPQALSLSDVRKSITFCRKLSLPVLGVIENMSGFVCPRCGEVTDIFGRDGGAAMCRDMGIPLLGRIPIDPAIVSAGDAGEPFAYLRSETPSGQAMTRAFEPILALDADTSAQGCPGRQTEAG